MEGVNYYPPEEALEKGEEPRHYFDLIIGGKKIGSAEIDFLSKPLPLYQVTELYVDGDQKGKGYAGQILTQVEEWLISRGKPGVVVEAILQGDDAEGMYEKRGWTPVPDGLGLHVYNWPSNTPLSILDGYAGRYTDHTMRKGYSEAE